MECEGRDFWAGEIAETNLLAQARSQDPFERWAAAFQLTQRNGAASDNLLRLLAGDSDELVRSVAQKELQRRGLASPEPCKRRPQEHAGQRVAGAAQPASVVAVDYFTGLDSGGRQDALALAELLAAAPGDTLFSALAVCYSRLFLERPLVMGYVDAVEHYAALNQLIFALVEAGGADGYQLATYAARYWSAFWGSNQVPGFYFTADETLRGYADRALRDAGDPSTILAMLVFTAVLTTPWPLFRPPSQLRLVARDTLRRLLDSRALAFDEAGIAAARRVCQVAKDRYGLDREPAQALLMLERSETPSTLIEALSQSVDEACASACVAGEESYMRLAPGDPRLPRRLVFKDVRAVDSREKAERVIRSWMRCEPGRKSYHLCHPTGLRQDEVAAYFRRDERGEYRSPVFPGLRHEIGKLEPAQPPWQGELDRLTALFASVTS